MRKIDEICRRLSNVTLAYQPSLRVIEKIHRDECNRIAEQKQGTHAIRPAHNTFADAYPAAGFVESID